MALTETRERCDADNCDVEPTWVAYYICADGQGCCHMDYWACDQHIEELKRETGLPDDAWDRIEED